jgi:hypothetical protein
MIYVATGAGRTTGIDLFEPAIALRFHHAMRATHNRYVMAAPALMINGGFVFVGHVRARAFLLLCDDPKSHSPHNPRPASRLRGRLGSFVPPRENAGHRIVKEHRDHRAGEPRGTRRQ